MSTQTTPYYHKYSNDIEFLQQSTGRLPVPGCKEHPLDDMSTK